MNRKVLATLTMTLGLGSVTLAQLYSSGNNQIPGNYVGIGTNDPDAKLQINNLVVMPSGGPGPSTQASDDPVIRFNLSWTSAERILMT